MNHNLRKIKCCLNCKHSVISFYTKICRCDYQDSYARIRRIDYICDKYEDRGFE